MIYNLSGDETNVYVNVDNIRGISTGVL